MLRAEVIEYIQENKLTPTHKLLLRKSPFADVSMSQIVQQIVGQRIAKQKYPFLLDFPQFIYPPKISLEQSSSILTAKYKANLVKGKKGADLTGGMGIDSYFFAKQCEVLTYVEPNIELFNTSKDNFSTIGVENIRFHNTTSEAFLESNNDNFDWIYLDPSRRIDGKRKTSIHLYEPNIVELRDQLLGTSDTVFLKLSPMQDISECVDVLENVNHIWIVSIGNEVKELLLLLGQEKISNPKMTIANLSIGGKTEYHAIYTDRHETISYNSSLQYIYQPDPGSVKAALHDKIAIEHNLYKLHPNTQLYTSTEIKPSYPGKIFEIIQDISIKKKELKQIIPSQKANIISKNHPLSPEQISAKTGINQGGTEYIIAFSDINEKKKVVLCKKYQPRQFQK